MIVCTRTGEADALTDAERHEVLQTAIGTAGKEKVMIAGAGRESIFASMLLAESAAAMGYDAVAVKGPAFSAHLNMRTELMTYFQAFADRSPLPLILMSNVERPLAIEVIGELAWHPNIIGVIGDRTTPERITRLQEQTSGVSHEVTVTTTFGPVTSRMKAPEPQAAGNFVSAVSLGSGATSLAGPEPVPGLKTRTKRVGFQVIAGATSAMLTAWRCGATGGAPRLGACAPQACCEVWQAFRDGDLRLAEEKQMRILAIGEKMEGWSGVAAVKHACDFNGYFGGRPRLPLIALSGDQQAELECEMAGLRN